MYKFNIEVEKMRIILGTRLGWDIIICSEWYVPNVIVCMNGNQVLITLNWNANMIGEIIIQKQVLGNKN